MPNVWALPKRQKRLMTLARWPLTTLEKKVEGETSTNWKSSRWPQTVSEWRTSKTICVWITC